MTSTHIIRRQFVDVEFDGSESDALALQNRLLALCRDELGLALECVLDQFAGENEHWAIDRLEIDAGTLPPDDLERLIAAVTAAVERQLNEIVSWAASAHAPAPTKSDYRSAPPRGRPTEPLLGPIQFKTRSESIRQAFLYFLETGVLPWWFRLSAGKTLEEVIRESWQQGGTGEAQPSAFTGVLRGRISSVALRKRLVRQFSPDFLTTLLSAVSNETAAAVSEILARLRQQDMAQAPQEFIEATWDNALLVAFAGQRATPATLITTSLQVIPDNIRERHRPFFERIITSFPATYGRETDLRQNADKAIDHTKPKRFPKRAEAPRSSLDLAEGIFTTCAGVVLLNPFLPRFFEALGIADTNKLLQPDRALCLLHYLASGQPFAPEYELLVPKVLCNLPLDTPVNSHINLTTAEEEESGALLQAVIRHWSVLGNTSIENLRGSFLVRPGKLSQREGEYLLQMETQSYDILLDQLPWGVGVVQLPWMQKTLWVEWRF